MGAWFSSTSQQVLNACTNNDLRSLQTLARNNPTLDINTIYDSASGQNPLMLASRYGHVDIVHFLITGLKANVNHRHPQNGSTSLHLASSFNQVDVVNMLLDAGADAFILTTKGLTCVDYARLANQVLALRALERRCALFSGYLRMQRSTMFQAGIGKLFGSMAKASLMDTVGGELRDSWIVVTNAYSFVCEACPYCRTKFDKRLGLQLPSLTCRQCGHGLGSDSITEVREIALYESPFEAKPEACYSFDRNGIPMQTNSANGTLVVPVRRNPATQIVEDMAFVGKNISKPIWRQTALTLTSPSTEYKKLVFISKFKNVNAFQHCLTCAPANMLELASRQQQAPTVPVATLAPSEEEEEEARWACLGCTFENTASHACCTMCTLARGERPCAVVTVEDDGDSAAWQVPPHFLCPISREVMHDPVVTCDGVSYDRHSISAHFAAATTAGQPIVSPVDSREVLRSTALVPNLALKRAIEEWKQSLPVAALVEV